MGSAKWILFDHLIQSNAKSLYKPQSLISFCITYVHVSFGLPLPLAWLRLITLHLQTGALRDLWCMCPNYFKRFSLKFSSTEWLPLSSVCSLRFLSFLFYHTSIVAYTFRQRSFVVMFFLSVPTLGSDDSVGLVVVL